MEGYNDQTNVNQDYYDTLRRSAQAQQNAAGQLAGIGAMAVPPAPPRTLASAMGGLDLLEKRLAEATDKALRLATLIGGPVPTQGQVNGANGQTPEKPHAMRLLNDRIEFAHHRVDTINSALDAMARSLGAIDG